MKKIVLIIIFSVIFLPGCLLYWDRPQRSRPTYSYKNIEPSSKINGTILYTGYQVNLFLEIDTEMLSQKFLSLLDLKVKDKLKVRSYSKIQIDEFQECIGSDGFRISTSTISSNQILIVEDQNSFDDQSFIPQRSLEFLNRNNDCDYYFSVLADVSNGNLLSFGKPVEPIVYINIYNKQGKKIFCKRYSRLYQEVKVFIKDEWQKRIVFYLDKLMTDRKDDINKDLDGLISH